MNYQKINTRDHLVKGVLMHEEYKDIERETNWYKNGKI